MKTTLEKNKEYSDRYKQKIKKGWIPGLIKDLLNKKEIFKIIDLGCGDGGFILGVSEKYKDKDITGVDISERRINDLKKRFPEYKFLCDDVCSVKFKEKFDLIVCDQVIEHVDDDKKLVDNIYKMLRPGGYVFITSVIKKKWAVYKYRNNGRFVLDPTHEREYPSSKEFLRLFNDKFRLLKLNVSAVKRKKKITFKIPGYYIIETLLIKNEDPS